MQATLQPAHLTYFCPICGTPSLNQLYRNNQDTDHLSKHLLLYPAPTNAQQEFYPTNGFTFLPYRQKSFQWGRGLRRGPFNRENQGHLWDHIQRNFTLTVYRTMFLALVWTLIPL